MIEANEHDITILPGGEPLHHSTCWCKKYTQVRITKDYRDKLAALAAREHRSMARQLEVMIDQAQTNRCTCVMCEHHRTAYQTSKL